VPHGTIAKDFAADLQNLEDSLALRAKMVADGASANEIAIVDGHIADLMNYIHAWTVMPGTANDAPGSAPFPGGATAVNDLAQIDDLTSQIEQVKGILETGLDTAGGEAGGHVGKFIQTKGIGGGGSSTVVPQHKTAKGYLGKPAGTAPAPGGGTATTPPTPTAEPVPQQGKTQTLIGQPTPTPATAKGETQVIGGKTEVGRPTAGQLNDAQSAAAARQAAADKAAQKSGFKDFAEMEVKVNEKKQRDYALRHAGDVELLEPRPGETKQQTAERYGLQTSLGGTKWDPQAAATNMASSRRELEQLTTGTSSTLKPTEKNLKILVDNHAKAQQSVRDGESKVADYWNRMTLDTRQMLQDELKASAGKDYNYWKAKLDQRGAGTSPPPYQETRVEPPSLGPIGATNPPRRVGAGGMLAVLAVGLVAVIGAVVLSNPGSPASPGSSGVAPGSSSAAGSVAVVVPGASPACRAASLLQHIVQTATQLALADACSRQMPDGMNDRVEYDGTAATVKPTVGDLVAVVDPEVELTAADAAAVNASCKLPPDPGTPPTMGPPGPFPTGTYCTATAPAAGKYEMYAMQFSTPIGADPDGYWEAGVGFTRGTGKTWESAVADPLTGHNGYYTIRFGLQGIFGPYLGAWSGEQGTFFLDQPTGTFAMLDGDWLLVFVPSAEWAEVTSCRFFTYYGRTDNSGGAVDLWPEVAEPATSC